MTIYLIRHAAPDTSRTDLPYDVPPGPDLAPAGRAEARRVAAFLSDKSIARVYASPFQRAQRTAAIVADVLGLGVATLDPIGEWHESERARDVVARVEPVLAHIREESRSLGPVCLFSHGGTIGVMLRKLGMPREEVDRWRSHYGGDTPAPHAGVWRITLQADSPQGTYELAFVP